MESPNLDFSSSITTDEDRQASIVSSLKELLRSPSLTPDRAHATGIALLCFAEPFLIGSDSLISYFLGLMQTERVVILKDLFEEMLQTFYSVENSKERIQ